MLMLAKTTAAILFGVINAFVPVLIAVFVSDLRGVAWSVVVPAFFLIAVSSKFLGLLIAVSVSEVFEAQTFSNFIRFPMIFLCGLFFSVERLPVWLKPLAHVLPLTYGVDILHGAIRGVGRMPLALNFGVLAAFCVVLFVASLRNIRRKWIA